VVSHTDGITFAISGLIPIPDASTIFLAVDGTGITTTNAYCTQNLSVDGAGTLGGNLSCKQITADGDLIFGSPGVTSTLRFNAMANALNTIQVNTSQQMNFNSQGTNWMRSDGSLTQIYTDLNVFTNTASAIRRLTVESQGTSGTPYITLKARNIAQASLFLTNSTFTVSADTTGVSLRYQTNATTDAHRFFTGATQAYTITNTGGANGSDQRWKSEVQNITGALAKIAQLQGKTFLMNGDPERRMGFIAQEVKEVVPEVVVVDQGDPEQYHFMQYDRLTALLGEGIKELKAQLDSLADRVAALEGNPA